MNLFVYSAGTYAEKFLTLARLPIEKDVVVLSNVRAAPYKTSTSNGYVYCYGKTSDTDNYAQNRIYQLLPDQYENVILCGTTAELTFYVSAIEQYKKQAKAKVRNVIAIHIPSGYEMPDIHYGFVSKVNAVFTLSAYAKNEISAAFDAYIKSRSEGYGLLKALQINTVGYFADGSIKRVEMNAPFIKQLQKEISAERINLRNRIYTDLPEKRHPLFFLMHSKSELGIKTTLTAFHRALESEDTQGLIHLLIYSATPAHQAIVAKELSRLSLPQTAYSVWNEKSTLPNDLLGIKRSLCRLAQIGISADPSDVLQEEALEHVQYGAHQILLRQHHAEWVNNYKTMTILLPACYYPLSNGETLPGLSVNDLAAQISAATKKRFKQKLAANAKLVIPQNTEWHTIYQTILSNFIARK
jgi:hypothetical protein